MTTISPWKKEHYDCMYSHKNLDDCCRDFQEKFPKVKLSSVFTHWNHKKQYLKDYEKLLAVPTDKQKQILDKTKDIPADADLTLDQRIKKLREILLSLNLRDAQDIPWAILTNAAKDIFLTEGTIRAVMFGYGTYKKRKTERYFKDIISTSGEGKKIFRKPISIATPSYLPLSPKQEPPKPTNAMLCPSCKNTLVQNGEQLKCNNCGYLRGNKPTQDPDFHTVKIKSKAITEPIKSEKILSNVIDDESINLWKYRSLRTDQVALMKELVRANEKLFEQSEKQTKILSKMLENFETAKESQLKRLAEEKEREDKKKSIGIAPQKVTA